MSEVTSIAESSLTDPFLEKALAANFSNVVFFPSASALESMVGFYVDVLTKGEKKAYHWV